MFYTSMLGDVQGEYKRSDSFPIVFNTEGVELQDVSIRVSEGRILVGDNNKGEEIFGLLGEDDYIPTDYDPAKRFTIGELADTEDNPLIVVLTNAVRFYANSPCLIKFLFINNSMMLAELVYGSCEFGFSDGSFIPLQRCDDSDLNSKKAVVTLNCAGVAERLMNSTKGGWDKRFEMVNPMCIIYGNDGVSARYRFLKKDAYVFNQTAIDEREVAEEKERLAKIKEEEEKRELTQRHLEEAKQRRAEEEREAALVKAQKSAEAREAKAAAKAESKVESRRVSAADFLTAVANAS